MKKVYFVRHGITEGNETGAYQLATISLSKTGLRQAEFVAKRFKTIQVDIIVASDMTRASQTAEAIGKELGKPVNHSELFREISRPSVVRGKTKEDPEVSKIMEEVKARFHDETWHYSDEENFHDLKARAERCLEYIKSLKEENVLVVTHGFILRMMTAVMALGSKLTPEIYKKLDHFFITKNTGITLVEEENGKYFLLTWNDHAHLGEVK
jgi:broad specificity phosphatase PhoE